MGADNGGAGRVWSSHGVVHLDPKPAVFDAMLTGWERQQRSRFLRESTIGNRTRLVRRFAEFTNLYPWQWTPAEGEAWISALRSGSSGMPSKAMLVPGATAPGRVSHSCSLASSHLKFCFFNAAE